MNRESFLANLAVLILRLIFLTVRLKVNDPIGFGQSTPKGPLILCFWHNRILAITLSFLREYPHDKRKGVTVLTSPSRDGEILSQKLVQILTRHPVVNLILHCCDIEIELRNDWEFELPYADDISCKILEPLEGDKSGMAPARHVGRGMRKTNLLAGTSDDE